MFGSWFDPILLSFGVHDIPFAVLDAPDQLS